MIEKTKNQKKVKVLVGLPASGKTTYAKECEENGKVRNPGYYNDVYTTKHVDFDREMRYDKRNTFQEIIEKHFWSNSTKNTQQYVIDGLFLKNDDIIKIINQCEVYGKHSYEIHYWTPNIEQCLINDMYRRVNSSRITIENAVLEQLNLDLIKDATKLTNIEVEYHEIPKKPLYRILADKYDLYLRDDRYIVSDKWSLGGNYGTCWDDTLTTIHGDTPPLSFEILDNFLEKICPNISFFQYKKLTNEFINIEETGESDYYGGSEDFANFICDLEELVNKLIDMDLINVNDF